MTKLALSPTDSTTDLRVNAHPLAAGETASLQAGDTLHVGGVALDVVAAPSADADALKAAFLRGAGIAGDAISADFTPELMELVGKLMASSLQGAIDLLALRSLVKQEVKADVTMVVVRNNNPLKFFPDSQTVLTQMLRKKMPGFMEPLESVDDAWHDLRGHQTGVVAGTRASMETMIERFAPERIEAASAAPSFIDTLLPSLRKAALWDQYKRQYAQLAGESKDQFTSVFGAAFLASYEQEVERFNREHGHG